MIQWMIIPNCNLFTSCMLMCVIAKSYRYVQNVKDWRYEFIDQDIINCILKCLIALMGYTQMLQRLNAKHFTVATCNMKKKSC